MSLAIINAWADPSGDTWTFQLKRAAGLQDIVPTRRRHGRVRRGGKMQTRGAYVEAGPTMIGDIWSFGAWSTPNRYGSGEGLGKSIFSIWWNFCGAHLSLSKADDDDDVTPYGADPLDSATVCSTAYSNPLVASHRVKVSSRHGGVPQNSVSGLM